MKEVKPTTIILGVVLTVVMIITTGLMVAGASLITATIPPTDKEIRKNFRSRKSDFETLMAMIKKDRLNFISRDRIDHYYAQPFVPLAWADWKQLKRCGVPITKARYEQYLSLLDRCEARSVEDCRDGSVTFQVFLFGTLCIADRSEKSIVYHAHLPYYYKSLDDTASSMPDKFGHEFAFSRIDKDWLILWEVH